MSSTGAGPNRRGAPRGTENEQDEPNGEKGRKNVLAVVCASYLASCGSPHRELTKKMSCEIARMMVVRKTQSRITSPTILYFRLRLNLFSADSSSVKVPVSGVIFTTTMSKRSADGAFLTYDSTKPLFNI